MGMKLTGAALALAGSAFLTVAAAPASAADTVVSCKSPVSEVASGRNGTAPRVTIICTGGSSAGNITYFGFRISDNPDVARLIIEVVGPYIQVHGPTTSIKILSDLSDTSGNAWGCAASNCRIVDFAYGY